MDHRLDGNVSQQKALRAVVEAVAVARLLTIAEALRAPVHVAHVSCAQALQVIRRFQRDGSSET